MYELFGDKQCGSAAVEVALSLCGVPYRQVEAYSTEDTEAEAGANPASAGRFGAD